MAALIGVAAIVGLFFAGFGCGWSGRGRREQDKRGGWIR